MKYQINGKILELDSPIFTTNDIWIWNEKTRKMEILTEIFVPIDEFLSRFEEKLKENSDVIDLDEITKIK